jgi:hypothetical protein
MAGRHPVASNRSDAHLVVGARPNYMKVAPVHRALAKLATQTIVHTGQHYDVLMSDIFFRQLDLPDPDINLEVGSGTHAAQTGQIMIRLEPVLLERRPDFVAVYGDVNSTVAATLVCSKLLIPIAHVKPAFGREIAPCRKRSTAWSPTPTFCLRRRRMGMGTWGRELPTAKYTWSGTS